ncbi:efflux RND transporter permease subunit [Sphingomonas sp. AOB5]|uniref:efflux RND transporter permease subunit n=1 Tax=Sphingomonas sp. AOB5 TaxID=3034017 RepID=UPI0023F9E0D8|nr:efflux RND transporter permease subunit [Sphingomonas sp. AOB5]MDF7774074.1 efflux RND transporter permease subunit [Sphingomonas sp. AOB5]
MNFASWSIRNPIPSILFFVLLTVAGIHGFSRLVVQDLPDMALPSVSLVAALPGATPAQLETEIARPIEDALSAIDGLRHVTTSISDGAVQIEASFVLEKPLSEALIQTKDAVDAIRSDLPADMLQPSVSASSFVFAPVMAYAASSSRRDEEALSWFIDDSLTKAVRAVPGVGKVERLGGVQREVRVTVDPARLAALGVTAGDVSRALREVQQQSSGGRGQLGGGEQSVRTIATVVQASELAALPIVVAGGRQVRLDQVATVEDGTAERSQAALLDGKHVVGFRIYRARGAGETEVADGVRAALDKLQRSNPDLVLTPAGGSIDYTIEQYDGSMAMLYEGALLAILVVWLFLRDWRATLIAATALPLSILPTFAAMNWLGYTLNTLTLLALAAVVGILVDDAIVEVENIERHRRMGKPVMEATEDAVNEIAKAVIATTFTLVAVFLPTALMSGFAGLFFTPFGWTAVIAVLASLLVARLLTPMMAAYFLTGHVAAAREDSRVMRSYLSATRWSLAHPGLIMAATGAFLAGSIALLPLIPTGFLPPDDRSLIDVSIELPPGSALSATERTAGEVGAALKDIAGIERIFTVAGAAGDGDAADAGGVRRAETTLLLTPRGSRPSKSLIQAEVRARLANIPGARFSVGDGGSGKIELILAGADAAALGVTAERVVREMRDVGTLSNISSTASLDRPEIIIRPDLQRAAERGVTAEAIGEVVRIATSGDFDAQVARMNLDSRQIFIRTRMADAARADIDTIANLRVAGRDGPVPLGSIATIGVESGPSQINRYDRERYISVTADLNGMAQGDALARIDALPAIRAMPSGVALSPAGGAEIGGEIASGFGVALIAGVLCIYCVLVLLFRDFLQPVTILSAIPLSIGGAFVALLLGGSALDMPAMIGLIMLMGIVTKNSILLVEYAILGITERGLSRNDALIEACRNRARPIVMTTVAMIAGMAPIALGFGADASFRQPMAIAVIGGLLTSTALSLLVVPVVFALVDSIERLLLPRRRSHAADARTLPEAARPK